MRKAVYLLAVFVLLAALAACGQGEEPPPAIEEQEIESAAEAEPVVELPLEESLQEEPLPAHLQYIVDAGQFSGERYREWLYTTYVNTALGIVYHYEGEEPVEYSMFIGAFAGEAPGELMTAWGFNDGGITLSVIADSGEQWVQQQADEFVERYIEVWLERDASNRFYHEYHGDDFEESVAWLIEARSRRRQSRMAWWAEHQPDTPFKEQIEPLTPDELDMVRFWPVEYEMVGRQFSGLQINVTIPGTSQNSGLTFLFHQIDDNTALVISIGSELAADCAAQRHIARFSALP